jgi:O-antigen ligase
MATTLWGRTDLPRAESAEALRLEVPGTIAGDLPATRLLVSYVVLVPLIFFAVHGGFSFEHGSLNNDLGAYGGKLAVVSSASESLRESMQAWTALMLCLTPIAFCYGRVFDVLRRMPLMIVLPLYAIASAIWSQDAALSLRSGIFLLAMTLFAFYLSARFSHRQQMELVMIAGSCVAAASVALALLWPQFGIDHQLHEGAWQGLFTQKNLCAEATLFLLTPALALPSGSRCGQILRASYIVLCLFLIVMSRSRTGWAMTAFYLGLAVLLRVLGRFERREMLPLAALLSTAAASVVALAVAYPSLALALIGRSNNLTGRAQIWSGVTESILRRPLGGYGYNAFWLVLQGEASRVYTATGWVVTSAHNGFLNLGLELGFVGLALVGATFVQAIRHANAAFYPGRSSYVDWCIGIVVLTLIYNLDERTLMATQFLPWILYIVACIGLRDAAWKTERQTMHAEYMP